MASHSGFLFFRGLRGLGLLIALPRPLYGLSRRFLFGRSGRRLLLLAAEPAPVAPTPQGVEEEAAKTVLAPTEPQREAGYCRKGQINIGDPDVTNETAMGAEEKFPNLFFSTRGKMRLRGQVYQSFGTGNRLRPIVDRSPFGASFFGIMRFKLRPGLRNSDPPIRFCDDAG